MTALSRQAVIAVVGAGTMGAGIAQVAASAGHPVFLFDVATGAAERGLESISEGLKRQVSRSKISQDDADAIVARITPCEALTDLASAALVIEAIVERLDVKQQLFADLEDLCAEETILATNTSSISITSIGATLQRPQRLVGMHFFNPAPVMKLVEVISGLATDRDVAKVVYDTALAWGKMAVMARSTPGFIVNRVARPFYAEALRILEEGGASVATIDAALRDCGSFRMGPFELMDLIGHDVNYAVTCSVFDAYYQDARFKPSLLQQDLVNANYLGRKSGKGFYDYLNPELNQNCHTQPPCSAPSRLQFVAGDSLLDGIAKQARDTEIEVARTAFYDEPKLLTGGAQVLLTDGRSATQVAVDSGCPNTVLMDLVLDFDSASRVVLAAADQCDKQSLSEVVGLFQALGKQVSVIDDVPGMIVMRTVCMLANEGADAVNQQVCTPEAVDTAMCFGVNYPKGPLSWADELGVSRVVQVLRNLLACYGEDRYRISPLLQRRALSGRPLAKS